MGQFSLNKATVEITKIIELQSRGKQINLQVSYASQALKNAKFLGDAIKYQQILINLLANAVKFSPANGKIEVKLSNTAVQGDDNNEG